jgi:hypothetical protein
MKRASAVRRPLPDSIAEQAAELGRKIDIDTDMGRGVRVDV